MLKDSKPESLKLLFADVFDKSRQDNVFLLSSSVSFHFFVSLIPIISVIVGIYLILNFNLDWNHFELAKGFLPMEVYRLLNVQVQRVNANMNTVNLATLIGFFISLWLSNNVTRAFAQSLNVVFNRPSDSRILYSLGASVLHTLLTFISVLFLLFALAFVPFALSRIPFLSELAPFYILAQWSMIFVYMVIALCFMYKYLPNHSANLPWYRFLPGSFFATFIGSVLALGFSFYARSFGAFSKFYGALGAVVVFLFWLRFTFSCVLLGGEINYFYLRKHSPD